MRTGRSLRQHMRIMAQPKQTLACYYCGKEEFDIRNSPPECRECRKKRIEREMLRVFADMKNPQ